MCETQKVEALRASYSLTLSSDCRKATKFHCRIATKFQQSRLGGMQGQSELGKALLQVFPALPSLVFVLESNHEIVRISNDHNIASGMPVPPLVDPEIKHIVQAHIC